MKTLEQRVLALEAEWEIRNLVATYLQAADRRDVEGYEDTFTPDGVLDIGGLNFDKVGMRVPAVHRGRAEIGRAYRTWIAPLPCFMWHLAHTPFIEVHGERATGRWNWSAIVNVPVFGPLQAGGVYHDEYALIDEGWKIARRAITSYLSMEYGKWNEQKFFGFPKP